MLSKMQGLTLRLWQRLKTEISKQSLHDVWEMEMELLPILIDTRRRGIRVDEEKADLKKRISNKKSQGFTRYKKSNYT